MSDLGAAAEDHPDAESIEACLRGRAGPAENRSIVLHLLRGCLQCQGVVRRIWYGEELPLARMVLVGQRD